MMEPNTVPEIHVLDKENYFTQAIVPIPSAVPYQPLGKSSIRVRTKVISLTSNNFTYAKLGFLFNWWNVYPTPSAIPAPYNDTQKYGSVSAWGWAEVIESTHAEVPEGSFLWGYQCIGTLGQDLSIRTADVPNQVIVTSDVRKNVVPVYNRYMVASGANAATIRSDIETRAEYIAYDALVRVMFETAYLMNRYALGDSATPPSKMAGQWTPQQADISDATIFVMAPGSKVGLCFAHELHARQGHNQVRRVVALASEHSLSYVENTELYDAVLPTTVTPLDALKEFGLSEEEKIVLVDCGGRGNIGVTWTKALRQACKSLVVLTVGSEISELPPSTILAGFQEGDNGAIVVNANDLRESAMKLDGAAKYFDELDGCWKRMLQQGIKGLKIRWGAGMDDVREGWDQLAKASVKPDEALAFVL